MNDVFFSNSFRFCTYTADKFTHTDNSSGSPSHYFAYMINGNCKIVTDTEKIQINQGDIFYIPNKCPYHSYWYGNPQIKFVSLGFQFLPNFDNKAYPVQVIPKNEEALKLIMSISNVSSITAKDIGIFYTLAGMLIPLMSYKTICRTREIVELTKNYLTDHPYAKISELAKNCTISEAALYSAFKKASDITPNQLRNHILLEKAKDMIITTDKPIEYISDFLEFSSTSYFRKKFKQYFNMTPKEMRKRYRV